MTAKGGNDWRRSLDRLRDDFEQQLGQITRRLKSFDPVEAGGALASVFGRPLAAAVDMEEDDEAIRVRAEMPGVDPDTLKVEVQGQRLKLCGEKRTARHESQRDCHYAECSYGLVSRSVMLPCEVNADQAEADYRDGVLTLRLPKPEGAKPRPIRVNVARSTPPEG
ncbi:MAG TPA: Hsp20/alpha crystallin family protein [Candidatus Sumerlaeota bacterium]|nr:Hsp20/alpha crystallin family protein [Candidatus Sumerlaeota bacterium]HOR28637.1 Hsp20/alpha crystallin family protein [Candidatus Sumerlaeota bacterium]HPK03348.1 Hsp20/alpha crystallin family protein [Candidatus Sumerlaeota bacterium]